MSLFPGALPAAGSAVSTDTLAAAGHTALHNTAYDEIRAIATKVGTGGSTPTNGTALFGNGVGTSAWRAIATGDVSGLTSLIFNSIYPVGSIYIETSGVNPGTTFGIGTWAAYAAGRTIIGVGTSDQTFNSGATGGESNHTLTSAEMPSHTHVQDAHTHTQDAHSHTTSLAANSTAGGTANFYAGNNTGSATPSTDNVTATNQNTTATNQNTGGGGSHNNLPPYQVVFMWTRTA